MINLLFCGNKGVFDGVLTLLISITNKTKEPVNAYVFTMDASHLSPKYVPITDEDINFVNNVIKSKNIENTIKKIDVTDLYNKEFGGSPNETAYCTPYTLLRLLADKVDEIPNKLLYLDIDMMAAKSISELYNIDITDYEYAAVKEKYGSKIIKYDYINAGMLLLNMKKIKETGLLEKARNLIRTKKMLFADQDAIFWSTTKKLILPRIYNEQSKFNKKDTVICHFCKRLLLFPYPRTENFKQWNVNEVHKILKCYAFDNDLNEYLKLKNEYNLITKKERKSQMNTNTKEIPIFFTVDNNYIPFLAVTLQSLVDNASSKNLYKIIILYSSNINEDNKKKIYKYKSKNIDIEFVDLKQALKKINDKLYTRDYYSKSTYYRLLIPELYPQYDKAIYLDSDIVLLSDIADFYNIDIGDNLIGATTDEAVQSVKAFQEYVEKVVGINSSRNYFNAGVLLMNLKELREYKFQEKFLYLLETIKFSVAQDQDYLNRICKGRVKLIDGSWDKMPIGGKILKEEDLNLIHYNLISKPWLFDGIAYEEYFWKYASKTEFIDIIKNIKANYSEEQKIKDMQTGDKLIELAQKEADCVGDDRIPKETKVAEKAKDRLEVLNKIENLEKEGKFDVDVEEDPPTIELMPDRVDYLNKKIMSKTKTIVANKIGERFLNDLIKDNKLIIKEIKGLENLQKVESGAMLTCNHFNPFDCFAIEKVFRLSGQEKNKKLYKIIREGNYTNFPGLYGFFFRNCNTLPLSSNKRTMVKFMNAVDTLLKKGEFILIYPEQSMWWNYRKPKPLKHGAFKLATRSNVPVIPIFITMEDSNIIGEDGFPIQEYTINISEPIYPDKYLSQGENTDLMLNKNYEIWKNIYEDFYKKPLEYLCDSNKDDTLK